MREVNSIYRDPLFLPYQQRWACQHRVMMLIPIPRAKRQRIVPSAPRRPSTSTPGAAEIPTRPVPPCSYPWRVIPRGGLLRARIASAAFATARTITPFGTAGRSARRIRSARGDVTRSTSAVHTKTTMSNTPRTHRSGDSFSQKWRI